MGASMALAFSLNCEGVRSVFSAIHVFFSEEDLPTVPNFLK